MKSGGAQNSRTTDQTTTYTYGATLTESQIAASTLLHYLDYPDSTGGSDRVSYAYNRQGQRTSVTDQRGCVHSYLYDGLGRLVHDCVTTLGTGVDGAVRRLTFAYEVRGLTSQLTSYDNASVGSGSVVNDVALLYKSFGQLTSDSQSGNHAEGSIRVCERIGQHDSPDLDIPEWSSHHRELRHGRWDQ